MVNRARIKENENIVYKGRGKGASLETPTVRIDINDIVFALGTSRAPRANPLNNAIPVAAHTEYIYINKLKAPKDIDSDNEFEVKEVILDAIRPLGQALNATVPNPEREEEQKLQLTVRTQGTGHIFNTGFDNIVPGDILMVDLYTRDELNSEQFKENMSRFGFGAQKVPLKLVTAKTADLDVSNVVKRSLLPEWKPKEGERMSALGRFGNEFRDLVLYIMWRLHTSKSKGDHRNIKFEDWKARYGVPMLSTVFALPDGDTHDPVEVVANKALRAFLEVHHSRKRREIGKALSYSKPGTGVDVLLGTY
jgi:hypothetical protein